MKKEKLITLFFTKNLIKEIINDVNIYTSANGGEFSSITQKIVATVMMKKLKKQKEKSND